MGLREMLQNLAATQQLTAGAAEAAGNFRKNEDLRAFAAQAPGLVEQGQLGQVAGQAAGLGQFGPLQSLISAQEKKMAQGPGTSEEQVRALLGPSASPEVVKALVGRDVSEIQNQARMAQQSSQFSREMGLKESEADRRSEESVQKQRRDFTADFNKTKALFDKDVKEFDKMLSIAKQGGKAADEFLTRFVARRAQGAGVLSDRDVDAFKAKYLQGDMNNLLNYASGNTFSTLSPDAKKDFLMIVQKLKDNDEKIQQQILGEKLNLSRGAYPKLYGESGVDKNIKEAAALVGFEVEADENGVPQFRGKKAQGIGNDGGKNVPPVDISKILWLDKIADQKIKDDTIESIKKRGVSDPAALEKARLKLIKDGHIKE